MNMDMFDLVLVLLCGIFLTCTGQESEYTVCARFGVENQCQQVARNHELKCASYLHRVNCLLNVDNGTATFGYVTAEQAALGARRTKNVVVLAEIQPKNGEKPYQTVVIVKRGLTNGFESFKSKKFCHPGFQFDKYVTDYVLQEFETKVIEKNNVDVCRSNLNSLKEKYIKSIAEYFGPSCRPGPWTIDDDFDASLKKKYPSLCELCDSSTSDKCAVKSNNPFRQALDCLIQKDADVAVSSLKEAILFFNNSENFQKYQYLCPDEVLNQPDIPCTWTNQLWDLIIANKNEAVLIKKKLQEWISPAILPPPGEPYEARQAPNDIYTKHLLDILNINSDYQGINLTSYDNFKLLLDYVQDYRPIPNEKSMMCNTDMKWCTISNDEQEKCLWLSQAGLNSGVQPFIKCQQSRSALECLEDIQTEKADVVTIDANYGYIAKRKNLVSIAFPESDNRLYVYLVIKSNEESITRFENLKHKKACFPEYGGIEWLTFIDIARTKGILSKQTCDYGKLISDFVSESCVPGANSNDHEVTENTDKVKLCSLCEPSPLSRTAKNCNTDAENNFYGVEGSLKCLRTVGDFAVIGKTAGDVINGTGLRVLCKNGTLASREGFELDRDCALAIITETEVITRRKSEKKEDYILALKELERRFGQETNKPFELFNEFGGVKDLLFKDSTPGLDFGNSSDLYVNNYQDLFKHIDQCVVDGKSSASIFSVPLLFISILCSFTLKVL